MTQQIRPARLRDGARIGIVSPAYWLDDERLQRAIGVFEDEGFVIVAGESTRLRENIFAGSPEARAGRKRMAKARHAARVASHQSPVSGTP